MKNNLFLALRILIVLVPLLLIFNGQAQSADTLFSDTFTGIDIDVTKWITPANTAGGSTVTQNGTLMFNFPGGSADQYAWLSSQSFAGPSQWAKINLSGYWGSPGLTTANIGLYVYNANNPSTYLEVIRSGTSITFIDSNTQIDQIINNSFSPASSGDYPDFSFRFSRIGWDYYENNVQLKHFGDFTTMASSTNFYIKIGGLNSSGSSSQVFGFDNINVLGSTAVPEPISCSLFIVGGAVLGISAIRKRREK